MAKHRRLNSECPFVLNPTSSGNVPMNLQSTTTEVEPANVMNENYRLSTFRDWPVIRTCVFLY